MESHAYNLSSQKFYFFYLYFQLRLINILNLKYKNQEYLEHYIVSVNIRLGEGDPSRRSVTLAVKELKVCVSIYERSKPSIKEETTRQIN